MGVAVFVGDGDGGGDVAVAVFADGDGEGECEGFVSGAGVVGGGAGDVGDRKGLPEHREVHVAAFVVGGAAPVAEGAEEIERDAFGPIRVCKRGWVGVEQREVDLDVFRAVAARPFVLAVSPWEIVVGQGACRVRVPVADPRPEVRSVQERIGNDISDLRAVKRPERLCVEVCEERASGLFAKVCEEGRIDFFTGYCPKLEDVVFLELTYRDRGMRAQPGGNRLPVVKELKPIDKPSPGDFSTGGFHFQAQIQKPAPRGGDGFAVLDDDRAARGSL